METINQSKEFELFCNNSNSFENGLNETTILNKNYNGNFNGIKSLSNSLQIPSSVISSLGSMDDVRKFYEIKNFIISNRNNLNNMKASSSPQTLLKNNSITIPSFNSNLNNIPNITNTTSSFYSNNIMNDINSLNNNKTTISSISIPSNINTMNSKYLYNNNNNNSSPNLEGNELLSLLGTQSKLPEIRTPLNTPTLMPLNTFDSINIPSTTTTNVPSTPDSIGNIMNPFSKMNSISSYSLPPSPISLNTTVSFPMNQNQLYLNQSLTVSASINNSYNISNNKSLTMKQLQLLSLIKLIRQKQLEEKNKRKMIDSLVVPSMLPNSSIQNNNQFMGSISNASNMDEKINYSFNQKQINDNLIKQLQLQQSFSTTSTFHSTTMPTSNTTTSNTTTLNNFSDIDCKNSIPSIIINDDSNNLFSTSPQELNNEKEIDISESDPLDLLPLLSKPEETNKYAPLSPALSPVLNSNLVEPSTNEILENCMKKNENNVFSSMETLNDFLSITPEMESIKTPDIENNMDFSLNNENENDLLLDNIQLDLDNIIEAIESEDKKIKKQLEEVDNNLLTIDNNDLLNIPATPKSISNTLNINNDDATEFSNCMECMEENNDNILNDVLNDTLFNTLENGDINLNFKDDLNTTTTTDILSMEPLLSLNDSILELSNSSKIVEKSDSSNINENEKRNENKRPRGRPRKKKVEDSPKEKIEKISKSIDNLLSSEFYNKLYSEERNDSIINQKNSHPKKVCFDQDYKFVKEVNTLNYLIVSYKQMCTALCKNNDQAKSEDTENQYDIPLKNMEEDTDEDSKDDEDKRCKEKKIEEEEKNFKIKEDQLIKEKEVEEDEECIKKEEEEEENKEDDKLCLDINIKDTQENNIINNDIINEIDEIKDIFSCEENEINDNINNLENVKESNSESENENEDEDSESSDNSEEESLLIKMKKIQEQQKIKINKDNQEEDENKKSINHYLRNRSISNIKEEQSNNKNENENENENEDESTKQKTIENIKKNTRKRKRQLKEDNEKDSNCNDKTEVYVDTVTNNNKRKKVVRLSITQIKNSLENGNRLTIGNSLGTNGVSALTKNGLVLIGRKRMIAENTNRPYVCSTCGAGFARKHDLNRHEKVHSGIKNYKCPYCERAFSRNDALTRHLRVELKHRAKNEESNKDGKKKYKKKKIEDKNKD